MIGLQRGVVKLEPYDPVWVEEFVEEKHRLEQVFGDRAVAIEHIGSTAVPDLVAKPIIDIAVQVNSLELVADLKPDLADIGYYPKEEDLKAEERLFFIKGPPENRTHYLKIAEVGSGYVEEAVLFRDHLREDAKKRQAYAKLKERLVVKYASRRERYTKEKNEFIKNISRQR